MTDFKNPPKVKRKGSANPKGYIPEAARKHQFKKGQSGNPAGGKLHNPAIRALRKLTVETYREVIELVVTGNEALLTEMINDPTKSVLQVGIARAFRNALVVGDYVMIERIAERIVGKIPEVVTVNSENRNFNLNADVAKETIRAALAKLESDV